MDEKEKERLEAIERVKAEISDLPNWEKEEIETSGELRGLALTVFLAERILRTSDPVLRTFQLQFEEAKNKFPGRRRDLQAELDGLEREQRGSTTDLIERGIKKLREVLQEVKLEESSQGRAASGFDGAKINVFSNRASILRAKGLVNSGIEILKGMSLAPVEQIREFLEVRLAEIQAIDFSPRQETVREDDFSRMQFLEKGVTP